jgi:hypothetical protein
MSLIVGLIALGCALVVFAIMLRVWAAVTRGAVSLTNAVMGGRDPVEDDFRRRGYDPNPIPRPVSLAGIRIPVPSVGYAILINIVSSVVSTAVQMGVMVGLGGAVMVGAANPDSPEAAAGRLVAVLAAFPAGLLATVVVLKMALPTTFVRAGVVCVFQFVLSLLLVVALGFGLALLTGGLANIPAMKAPGGGGSGWVR